MTVTARRPLTACSPASKAGRSGQLHEFAAGGDDAARCAGACGAHSRGGAATAVAREPPKHGLERTRQRLNNRSHEIRASPTTCVGRRTTRRGPVDFRTDDQPRFALGRLGEAWCGPPRTVARPMGRQKHGGLLRGAAGARRLVDHGTRASARALSRPACPAECAACRRGARLVTRQAAPSRYFTAQPSRVHGRQPACPFRKLVQTDGDSDA